MRALPVVAAELARAPANPEEQQALLAQLKGIAATDDNRFCSDCGAQGTTWAAWNLGIFICLRCAGFHRGLGSHVSKVKSLSLDVWTKEQVAAIMALQGHANGRSVYEKTLPIGFQRPRDDTVLMAAFIQAKYVDKKVGWFALPWSYEIAEQSGKSLNTDQTSTQEVQQTLRITSVST